MAADRHNACFVAFADYHYCGATQINILEVGAGEFRQPEARRIEQLQNGMIPKIEIRHRFDRNELCRLLNIQRVGQFAFAARCGDALKRIQLGLLFAQQIPITGPRGRQGSTDRAA